MRSVYSYAMLFVVCLSYGQNSNVFDIARKGTVAEAQMLLDKDPYAFSALSPEGFTPLILACYRGNNDVAAFLISHGSDVNVNSPMGTALMAAVVKGNTEIAKLLLESKAKPDMADANGTTALIYAVKFQNSEIIKLLLTHKADKSLLDKDKKSAFEYATFSGNESIIQLLK
ncbi:MAG TPA: ankyrin repeat domain-containing protein [Flavobacterium sp.]